MVKIVSEEEFKQEVLESDVPVLVDFFAIWCGPCQMMTPDLETFAQQQEGKVKVCKVDIDKSRNLAMQYEITAVPTLMFFNQGELVREATGARPLNKIEYFCRL